MVEFVYSTTQLSAKYCKQLYLDNNKAEKTLREVEILTMYQDLLYYLLINDDFLTQDELINICSFINHLTSNTTDIIDIDTI